MSENSCCCLRRGNNICKSQNHICICSKNNTNKNCLAKFHDN